MPSPRYWRERPNRFRLEAARCTDCQNITYPARVICPACRGRNQEAVRLSHNGKVVTSTVVHVPPNEFLMEAPYAIAVMETPEGARFMAQVVDCDPATVLPGVEVELEFRLIRKEGQAGILCYGYKAVPVPQEQ